jgi:ParB-like chromosome segregation protein Spo0J
MSRKSAAAGAKDENGAVLGELRVEYRRVADLVPYARNARTHSEEQVDQIAASVREFGFTNPVLVDAGGGIVAGHGRVMAAEKLGMDKIPCISLGWLKEAQKRAYVIADNNLALNAGWNEELLRLELTDLKDLDVDLRLLGFDEAELADILLGKDVEFKEFDESTANDVKMIKCPHCGQEFPK